MHLKELCFSVQPFQPTAAPVPAPLAGWMSNPSAVTHPAVSGGGAIGLGAPSIPGKLIYYVFESYIVIVLTR